MSQAVCVFSFLFFADVYCAQTLFPLSFFLSLSQFSHSLLHIITSPITPSHIFFVVVLVAPFHSFIHSFIDSLDKQQHPINLS